MLGSSKPSGLDWSTVRLPQGSYRIYWSNTCLESFDAAIVSAICTGQVIDIKDPAIPGLYSWVPTSLKGRILLAQSCSEEATRKDKAIAVIANVNQSLDQLIKPGDEQRRLEQRRMVSEAVAHLDGYELARLNKYGPEINDEMRAQNLLCGAIVTGDLVLVQSLLRGSQSPTAVVVNKENPYFVGRPLHLAAAWGHLDIVQYLLDSGADPRLLSGSLDGDDDEGNPDAQHVRLPDRHIYQSPNGSVLRAAALGGHEKIIHLLLKPEYRRALPRGEYLRAILAGARGGHLNIINVLLQAEDESLQSLGAFQEEMLWEAVRHNQEGVVGMLLDNGVDVNAPPYADGRDHGTALHIAASQGHHRLVQILLSHGADVHRGESLRTPAPINAAARGGHEEAVRILLDNGASAGEAFISAADGGQVHLVRSLLQKGEVDVHAAKDDSTIGMQALERAIITKNPSIISILVADAGVTLNHDTPSPRDNPIIVAKTYAAQWIVDFLLSLGGEDREFDPEDQCDCFPEDCYAEQVSRGGIRITQRTWEWVGKY